METKSPWNEYGVAKVQELKDELMSVREVTMNNLSALDRIEQLLDAIKLRIDYELEDDCR